LEYLGCKIEVFEGVYKPCDDSFLLAENLEISNGEYILELGTGCGLISILAAKGGAKVISTDISEIAIRCAKYNSIVNKVKDNIHFLIGDLFEPLKKGEIFDQIIFNPPYLPDNNLPKDMIERAWWGGTKGNEVILKFIDNLENYIDEHTLIQLIISTLSNPKDIFKKLDNKNFKFRIKKSLKLFFEELYLIEINKK